jgi:hypothetical protein
MSSNAVHDPRSKSKSSDAEATLEKAQEKEGRRRRASARVLVGRRNVGRHSTAESYVGTSFLDLDYAIKPDPPAHPKIWGSPFDSRRML